MLFNRFWLIKDFTSRLKWWSLRFPAFFFLLVKCRRFRSLNFIAGIYARVVHLRVCFLNSHYIIPISFSNENLVFFLLFSQLTFYSTNNQPTNWLIIYSALLIVVSGPHKFRNSSRCHRMLPSGRSSVDGMPRSWEEGRNYSGNIKFWAIVLSGRWSSREGHRE